MLNLGMGFLSMAALLALVIWDLTSGNQVTLETRMVVMMVIAMMMMVAIVMMVMMVMTTKIMASHSCSGISLQEIR